jgi:DNA-binding NtrC family response regulator
MPYSRDRRSTLPTAPTQLACLVGNSPAINAIRAEIETITDASASVLITGPSGSGKDVVAQLLHQRSRRAARPFVALNCAAVAADLLESEMFGHEAGAFTGAVKARPGRFEAADTGTLFLDEVGDMAPAMQVKLLRALETRIVERVGGMLPIAVDVRLIAATSVDLFAAIDRGHFRADLLYRLDVVRIEMPPLVDRPEDVPLLVEHFCSRLSGAPVRFDAQAMATLAGQPWPGNVRELKNLVDRAQAHFAGQTIGHTQLSRLLRPAAAAPPSAPTPPPLRPAAIPAPPSSVGAGIDLKRLLADMESAYITEALTASGGAIAATAKLLGLQRTTLIEKMRRLQIGTA